MAYSDGAKKSKRLVGTVLVVMIVIAIVAFGGIGVAVELISNIKK